MSDLPDNDDIEKDHVYLIRWLSKEDYSLLGECNGAPLNALIRDGYAEIVHVAPAPRVWKSLVALTPKGWDWLKRNPERPPSPPSDDIAPNADRLMAAFERPADGGGE